MPSFYILILWLYLKQIYFAPTEATSFYPSNSAYGIFAAIAVPLDLANRNVFISYNFEANYDLPEKWSLQPDGSNLRDDIDFENQYARNWQNCSQDINNNTTTHGNFGLNKRPHSNKRSIIYQSLLTRRNFYYILANKFQSRNGFEGTHCLLRLICEINSYSVDMIETNGVLGHLLHVLFTPTTSRYENLPLKYYTAELYGRARKCHSFRKSCTESILDLITVPLHQIIDEMLT